MKFRSKLNIKTDIFNRQLYLEGLRRLRVVGLVLAILSVTLSALIPIVTWMGRAVSHETDLEVADGWLIVPTVLLIFLSPLFIYVLFSFLHKRKTADFFHAIPYTRTCVYVSFVAAALTVIAVIQAASSLVSALLWFICPLAEANILSILPFTVMCFLSAALLSSVMAAIVTVTGTGGVTLVLYWVLPTLPRIAGLVFYVIYYTQVDFLGDFYLTKSILFSPLAHMPWAVLWQMVNPDGNFLYNPAMIIYTLLVTLGLFALGCFFYNRRHSEWAGNSAPGKRTQTIFRLLFVLPQSLCIPLILFAFDEFSIFSGAFYAPMLLSIVVDILLRWFLYELITTRSPRAMLRAVNTLWLIPAVLILFTGTALVSSAITRYEKIDAREIRAVAMPGKLCTGKYNSYSYFIKRLDYTKIKDKAIKKVVAEALYNTARNTALPDGREYEVALHLWDGRTIYRKITFSQEQLQALSAAFDELDDYDDLRLTLPEPEEVSHLNPMLEGEYFRIYQHYENKYFTWDIDSEREELYAIFYEEYHSLTDEQKTEIWGDPGVTVKEEFVVLSIQGRVSENRTNSLAGTNRTFHQSIRLTENLPRTRAWILQTCVVDPVAGSKASLPDGNSLQGSGHDILPRLATDETLQNTMGNDSYSMKLTVASDITNDRLAVGCDDMEGDRLVALIEYLYVHQTRTRDDDDPPPATADSRLVNLTYSGYYDGTVRVTLELSKEDIAELRSLFPELKDQSFK